MTNDGLQPPPRGQLAPRRSRRAQPDHQPVAAPARGPCRRSRRRPLASAMPTLRGRSRARRTARRASPGCGPRWSRRDRPPRPRGSGRRCAARYAAPTTWSSPSAVVAHAGELEAPHHRGEVGAVATGDRVDARSGNGPGRAARRSRSAPSPRAGAARGDGSCSRASSRRARHRAPGAGRSPRGGAPRGPRPSCSRTPELPRDGLSARSSAPTTATRPAAPSPRRTPRGSGASPRAGASNWRLGRCRNEVSSAVIATSVAPSQVPRCSSARHLELARAGRPCPGVRARRPRPAPVPR